jgi:hypothetical protein
MGFLTPIVTNTITPVISVSMPLSVSGVGITYSQFLQSLGTQVYGAEFFYMSANNYPQISQAIAYNHFDAAGNQVQTYLPFVVDPYQYQPSIYYDTNSSEIIFDGFSSLTFDLLKNSNVYLKFFAEIEYMAGALDETMINAFQDLEEVEGISFFDDYCNYLIDKE